MTEPPQNPQSMTRIFGRSPHRTELTFREKWLAAVRLKNSVLCAGLDPAEFTMGRGEEGLDPEEDKGAWAVDYVHAVGPYVAVLKYNVQYWRGIEDGSALQKVRSAAREHGLVVIEDAKLADIGSTNDAGMFYAALRADAVTLAPFAGNMEEAARQAKERELGLIAMCLMSNPEYDREKSKLVPVDSATYQGGDLVRVQGQPYVPQFVQLAHDAHRFGLDAIVIGAPINHNHIAEREVKTVRDYVGNELLVLLPGLGAQGGEAQSIWKHFDRDQVIVNVGRALMFPKDGKTSADAAQHYRDMLNELRDARRP